MERIINDPNFLQEETDSKLSANNSGYYLFHNLTLPVLLNKYMRYQIKINKILITEAVLSVFENEVQRTIFGSKRERESVRKEEQNGGN